MVIKQLKKLINKKRINYIKKYLKSPYKYNWYALLEAAMYFWRKTYEIERNNSW